jgi:hypothetical protein
MRAGRTSGNAGGITVAPARYFNDFQPKKIATGGGGGKLLRLQSHPEFQFTRTSEQCQNSTGLPRQICLVGRREGKTRSGCERWFKAAKQR